MDEIKIFNDPEFGSVRTANINGEPWFVGKDVCEAFGDTNYRRSLSNIDDYDKGVSQIDTLGGKQNMTIINESGLYSLLFQMQPQKAKGVSQNEELIEKRIQKLKRFKHWVTSEILPSIRKHGMYAVDDLINDPDLAIKAFTALREERNKNKLLMEDVKRMKPKEEFFDAVADSKDAIEIGKVAKVLNFPGIGRNKLFEILRRKGILMKDNIPYQKFIDNGCFRTIEQKYSLPDGETRISIKTLVYQKGVDYIRKVLETA